MLCTRIALVVGLTGMVACASPYRKETLGTAAVVLGDSSAQGVKVAASSDPHEVSYQITTPRAMQLQYAIRCPGGERRGSVGEGWADYQERRLAEISRARQQEVNTKASIVGAVVGQVQTQEQAEVGPARGEVTASVDGAALGQAVGEATTQEAQLPAWDVGAQVLHQRVRIAGGEAGACSMSLWSEIAGQDMSGVTGQIEVVRMVDKGQEKRAQQEAANERALVIRGEVKAGLIASGADIEYRRKIRLIEVQKAEERRQRREQKRQVELRLRAESNAALRLRRAKREREEREKQVALGVYVGSSAGKPGPARRRSPGRAPKYAEPGYSAEAVLQLQAEKQRHQLQVDAALRTRTRLIAWCTGNGADPYHRARLRKARYDRDQAEQLEVQRRLVVRAEAEKERRLVRERQLALDLRTRQELYAWLIATGADPDYRQKKDEADLQAFAERARDAKYAQIRADGNREEVTFAEPEMESREVIVSASVARPPRPEVPQEVRPGRPNAQASWIAGFYEWRSSAWIWVPGTWSTPPVVNAIWIPTVEIQLGGKLVTRPGAWQTRTGRRVGTKKRQTRVHDHR